MPPKKQRREYEDQPDEVQACTVVITKLTQEQLVAGSTSGFILCSTLAQQVKSCEVVITQLTPKQLLTCSTSGFISSSSVERAGTTDTRSSATFPNSLALHSENSKIHKSSQRGRSKKMKKKK